jgi:hypothetical protein
LKAALEPERIFVTPCWACVGVFEAIAEEQKMIEKK